MAYPAYHAAAGPTGWYQALKDYIDAGDAGVSNFLVEHNSDGTHDFPGTPTGLKFLRDDRTWAVPPAGGGGSGALPAGWVDAAADYGVLADASSDDTAAIQAALDAVAATVSGSPGGVVYGPKGTSMITGTLDIPTYTRLIGPGDNSWRIKADSSFPISTPMITIGPGALPSGDVYGSGLEHLRLDCNSISGVQAIYGNDMNEHCGLFDIEVRNCNAESAIYITQSLNFSMARIGATGSGGTACKYLIHLISNGGRISLRDLSNLTTGHTPAVAGSAGVRIESTPSVLINGFHGEFVESVLHFVSGGGGVVLSGYGHSSVTNVVHIDASMAAGVSSVFYAAISTGGSTKSVKDIPGGYIYSGDIGAPPPATFTPARITLPSSIGTGSSITSNTTCTLTVTKAVPVGDHVFVGANWGGTSNTIVSVTDTKSNTYQHDVAITPSGSPGTIPGDAVLASSRITTALVVGDVITLTVTNATSSKAMVAITASGLVASSWLDKTANTNTNSTSPFTSGATATTAQAAELLIGLQANNNSDGQTADSPFAQVDRKTIAGARQVQLAAQVVAATGAYAFTGTMTTPSNYLAVIATYKY